MGAIAPAPAAGTPRRGTGSSPGPGSGPGDRPGVTAGRRVRHEVRDGLAVMLFSLTASAALALCFRLVLAIGA